MRDALASALYKTALEDERVVVVVADISPAGAMDDLRREVPSRFINVGVAEQAMIGLAAGLAMRGFRPFCYTIATFALFRPYEFIRCDLAYQNLPVTVVGMGAGLAYSTLGGTHQAVEDVAVATACPNMTVLAPCDPAETAECVRWCAARESGGPVYLRIGKAGEPDLTSGADPWKFGAVRWLRRCEGATVCIATYGPIASVALGVADALAARGIVASVASFATLSEMDVADAEAVLAHDRVLVVEEAGGAPLANTIKMMDEANKLDIGDAFCLPYNFLHVHGTRDEVLDAACLSVRKIMELL